jgi:hypothetical protein
MNTEKQGKFVAIASVFGRSLDSAGNIIDRDPHGFPSIWLSPIAGSIPNRNTLAGSVARRAGILLDGDGVIAPGESKGHPFAKRVVYGEYILQSIHEEFGPQYAWTIIKDMSNASAREIDETCAYVGEPDVFAVAKPNLPADYQRKTTQHIGRSRMDDKNHPVQGSRINNTNPVLEAKQEVTGGPIRSDVSKNPEVVLEGDVDQQGNPISPINITNK